MADSAARVAATPVVARVLSDPDPWAPLGTVWRRLFDRSTAEPSASFEWTRAVAATQLARGDVPFVVELSRAGEVIGLVPIIHRTVRVWRLPYAVLLPLAELKNTHSDLLIEHTPGAVAALLTALTGLEQRWDCLRLSKLLDGHPLLPLLEAAAGAAGLPARRKYWKASYLLRLPSSFDVYLAQRSAKFRNHARRAEKKLRAAGDVRVEEITATTDVERGFDALMEVERQSWKQGHGTSMEAIPAQEALYRLWARDAARAGRLHLQLLWLNGQPIAGNLGCVHRGVYSYLKTSYAAAQRPLGPATFLRLRLIESLIARGIGAVDFCGTPYEWERQWTDTYRWQHVLSIYAPHWRGRLLAHVDRWTHHWSAGGAIRHEDPRAQRPPAP